MKEYKDLGSQECWKDLYFAICPINHLLQVLVETQKTYHSDDKEFTLIRTSIPSKPNDCIPYLKNKSSDFAMKMGFVLEKYVRNYVAVFMCFHDR